MNPLIYRDIQIELQAYLGSITGLKGSRIYIDPETQLKEPFIFIDYMGTTDLKWSNNIDIKHEMTFKIRAQIYNSNNRSGINREVGDGSYQRMGDLYTALHSWFCRNDTVNQPMSKKVNGSSINIVPVVIENLQTKQVKRAMDFDVTFTYNN